MRKKIFLLLAISWMGVIFYMSNQPASISSAQSGGVIEMLSTLPVIGNVIKAMTQNGTAEFVIRKSAHAFSYATLAVLCFMSMYDVNINLKKISIISFLVAFIYACTDEIHQLFVNGRSGEVRDVLVDSIGAFIGICIVYLIIKLIEKKKICKG
ncbi:MAG: VanZ family protein [Romboutsia sp.]|uniref:VanZ family protein n=1 Tax=Romboutsia sp. TaxID=1965302 RepID=UPI003F3EF307